MNVFYWIVDLLIPSMMIVIGLIFRKWIPKNINYLIGYRTKRSMSSQDAWVYANHRFAALWLKMGCWLLTLVVLSKLLFSFNPDTLSISMAALGIAAMLITIPIVERELKQKFER